MRPTDQIVNATKPRGLTGTMQDLVDREQMRKNRIKLARMAKLITPETCVAEKVTRPYGPAVDSFNRGVGALRRKRQREAGARSRGFNCRVYPLNTVLSTAQRQRQTAWAEVKAMLDERDGDNGSTARNIINGQETE